MAQVNGRLRLLTTRLSSERVGSVKYSMLCPSRMDTPFAASRAIPISLGRSGSGSNGRVVIFAFYSPKTIAAKGVCQADEGKFWLKSASANAFTLRLPYASGRERYVIHPDEDNRPLIVYCRTFCSGRPPPPPNG